MNHTFKWPTEKPKIIQNFLQTGIDLLEEKIGALSQDPHNPLSRVCVANSCISLEPVRGCPLGCIYCVAGNDCRNLTIKKEDYRKSCKTITAQLCTIEGITRKKNIFTGPHSLSEDAKKIVDIVYNYLESNP